MTELLTTAYEIPAAELGPENPLPVFRDPKIDSTFDLDESVSVEERKYMGWRTGFRVLPHRMQDGYNRKRSPRAFHALVLENEWLRATFLPELGGRLVSLIHKAALGEKPGDGRELLERNPVFQPANLALRNAWFSGGIEWNTSQLGHYYLTCSPVFAARVPGIDGAPVLRLYEWDRVKCFPWQIDFHLPPDSPFLFARMRLVNPHDYELAMYWWTNISLSERPESRVLFPAETALGFCENRKIGLVQLPTVLGVDASYTTNITFAQEMFARIPEGRRRWAAHLDEQGKGFIETSTDRLRGRKMFCWGMNQGGRRWQEYLSVPGNAYIELQAGLARTQLETVPMPAHAEWTWTEAFGLLEADPAKVHSDSYTEAWRAVDAALEAALPRAKVQTLDRQFAEVTGRPPDQILWQGSGWGALERRRLARQNQPDRIPQALVFDDTSLGPDQEMWLELLDTGRLPERDPVADPGCPMVQVEWHDLLEDAVRSGRCDHWLAWLHLGIMRLEALDADGAKAAWEQSLERRHSGWAYRNLAIVHQRAGDPGTARDCLCQAWELAPGVAQLALDYARILSEAEDYEALGVFVENMPEDIRQHERMRIIIARAALETGHYEDVEGLFDHDFATIRECEVTLTDLWFAMHEKRIAAKENIPIDDALRKRVRRECPPPARIDFRMAADPN